MSRRRYVSTDVSTDTQVNRLARTAGDFAVMLYTWLIPHADDEGVIYGDEEEIILQVIPGRRDKSLKDVVDALDAMVELDLIAWDREGRRILFPTKSFYKYQSYIREDRRRQEDMPTNADEPRATPHSSDEQRKSAQISANQRSSPQITASLNPSHSPSHSGELPTTPTVSTVAPSAPQVAQRSMFGALSQTFGEPTQGTEHTRYEKAAKDLITAGVDPSEIPRLHEAWSWVNPGVPRVNSLAGQITILRNAKPPEPNARAPNGKYLPNGHANNLVETHDPARPWKPPPIPEGLRNSDDD